ncbi:hypothetical protein FXB41_35910 [Bradyrhizobium canariense]|nr:hypothetical protein [Bradyrhizobium canariense]
MRRHVLVVMLHHTPSLRAQRSNPETFRGGTLDCFAALAMTMWRDRPTPPRPSPSAPRRGRGG